MEYMEGEINPLLRNPSSVPPEGGRRLSDLSKGYRLMVIG